MKSARRSCEDSIHSSQAVGIYGIGRPWHVYIVGRATISRQLNTKFHVMCLANKVKREFPLLGELDEVREFRDVFNYMVRVRIAVELET